MPNNNNCETTEDTFLRNLAPSRQQKLASILDIENSWETVAAKIPRNPDLLFDPNEEGKPRYTMKHIFQFKSMGGSPTRNLLMDWGTKNVRLKHLVQVLRLTNLQYAADFIEIDVLHKPGTCLNSTSESQVPTEANTENSFIGQSLNDGHASQPSAKNETLGLSDLSPLGMELDSLQHNLRCSQQDEVSLADRCPVRLAVENAWHPAPKADFEIERRDGGGRNGPISGLLENSPRAQDITVQTDRGNWAPIRNGGSGFSNEREASKSSQGRDTSELSSDEQILPDCAKDLKEIPYVSLQKITNNFDITDASKGGRLIGEGGFGHVFLGIISNRTKVAVKCLKDDTEDTLKQFLAEIKTLCSFQHINLVHLMAYSHDGGHRCLVYEYMVNGSLEDRLACKHSTPPLSSGMRLEIVKGTARGIEFLHENGLIHRDIKSANILLDTDFTPKVGDFATARITPWGKTTKMLLTSKIIGTQVYLAPEAYTGHIHIGLDCYSFGVVLLELLTGLSVLDRDREEQDLRSYVQEHCEDGEDDDDQDEDDEEEAGKKEPGTIFDLLDKKAGSWEPQTVELLFAISNKCLEYSPKKRAKMAQIMKWLEAGKISQKA